MAIGAKAPAQGRDPVYQGGPEHAAFYISTRRGDRRKLQHDQSSTSSDLPHQVQVFHPAHLRDTAHRLQKAAANEEGLITIGQSKQGDAKAHTPLEGPQSKPPAVEVKAKCPTRHTIVRQGPGDCLRPARPQARIGVEEQNGFGGGRLDPQLELACPSRFADEHTRTGSARALRGVISTAAVDDDDLDPWR